MWRAGTHRGFQRTSNNFSPMMTSQNLRDSTDLQTGTPDQNWLRKQETDRANTCHNQISLKVRLTVQYGSETQQI